MRGQANKLSGREAREASALWNLTKSLLQTSIFWSLFLYVLPTQIRAFERAFGWNHTQFASPALHFSGYVLLLLFSVLGLASCYTMAVWGHGTPLPTDSPRQLVIVGPYRYVRNPMAIAGPMQAIAIGLFTASPLTLFYSLTGMVFWNLWVRPWEESELESRFGEPFKHYRAHVRCWIPHLHPYNPSD